MSDDPFPGVAGLVSVMRPRLLILPASAVLAGTAAAGAADPAQALLALLGTLAVCAAVNVRNEVGDFESGVDLVTQRTPLSGGSGAIPGLRARPRHVRLLGRALLLVAAGVAVYFLVTIGKPIRPIIMAGALIAWLHTPHLVRSATGEIAAGFGLGVLPVIGAALVQEVPAPPTAWAVAWPAGVAAMAVVLLNAFPDEVADRAGRRRNLVHRLGRNGAAVLYAALVLMAMGLVARGVAQGTLPGASLWALAPGMATVPALRWAFTRAADEVPVQALVGNMLWAVGANLALGVGFLVLN